MMNKLHLPAVFERHLHLWIVLALLLANGLAWMNSAAGGAWPEVAPRLDPQIAKIREDLWSGKAKGQEFEVTITNQMAAEAVAWFLERHPNVPFSHPQVEITPQGITGRGLAHVAGLRTPLHGTMMVGLDKEHKKLDVELIELGVANATLPAFVMDILQGEISAQFTAAENLPMKLEALELREGEVYVKGKYK